jgi:YegS/Rv2252/BmrU family lipid kinase
MIKNDQTSIRQVVKDGGKHYLFIINPHAGRKHMKNLAGIIDRAFLTHGMPDQYSIVMTDRGGHAIELAAAFADKYGDQGVAVACGGDGTINEVAQALYGSRTALAVLPIGTANDFVKTVYPGKSLEQILDGLFEPTIRPIDCFFVDERICINIMSLGFDTKVQKAAGRILSRHRWLGSASYPFAIVQSLFGTRDYDMHYKFTAVDDEGQETEVEASSRYILAAVCNARYYGGGYNPAPAASIEDGLLDLCLVDSLNLIKILGLIGKYKKVQHLCHPAIHYYRVKSGEAKAEGKSLLLGNIDGEQFEKDRLGFEIRPSALDFVFIK